ncbi:MAG: MFS transporter [Bacteroidetes bacterium]|nr:MAG: MFS transporter [Bacteroidota bacterium]
MFQKFPYRYRVLILLFFLISITLLDRMGISLVGVRIKSEFHLSNTQFGWALTAFSLAYTLFEIPSGRLGDKWGQKATLIRIVLWWSVFTALTGMVTGLISLIIVRFLFGIGEAGAFPNTMAVISRWFPAGETSRSIAVTFIGLSLGMVVAPLIVVPVMKSYGWRMTFFVNAIIGAIWVLICWRWFKNNPSEMKGISYQERKFIEENRKFNSHSSGIPWKQMFRSRTLLAISYAHFCAQWSAYFLQTWLAILLVEGRHLPENKMKLAVSFIFIPSIPAGFFLGLLGDRIVRKKGLTFGRRFVSTASLALMGLSYLVAAMFPNNTSLITGMVLAYLFQIFYSTASYGICIDISDNCPATVTSVMNTCGQLGSSAVAIIFGLIVDHTHNYNLPLYVIAVVLFTGSLTCLSLEPTRKLNLEPAKLLTPELATSKANV